jgi:nucleotide-binding universal stress UspA family protein
MKRILFPTDFSEVANNAFVYALELAKFLKAEIILLHTYELPIVDNQLFPANYTELFDSVELVQFDKFKHEIPKLRSIASELNLDQIAISHRLMVGDLIQNIKETVVKDAIDFVVMGTSGAKGWFQILEGSNAGNTISSINVPLLSIPNTKKYKKIESFAFTTRYREKDKIALRKVIEIAKKLHAEVKCLYVQTNKSDVSEVVIQDWEKEFEREPINFFILADDDVKQTILDFITHQDTDVLAILTYKRSFFASLFDFSLTEKLAYNCEIPILALHE